MTIQRIFFYGVGGPKVVKLPGRLGTRCASLKKKTILASLILGSLIWPCWEREGFGRKFYSLNMVVGEATVMQLRLSLVERFEGNLEAGETMVF